MLPSCCKNHLSRLKCSPTSELRKALVQRLSRFADDFSKYTNTNPLNCTTRFDQSTNRLPTTLIQILVIRLDNTWQDEARFVKIPELVCK